MSIVYSSHRKILDRIVSGITWSRVEDLQGTVTKQNEQGCRGEARIMDEINAKTRDAA
jgi:hypothetical protein